MISYAPFEVEEPQVIAKPQPAQRQQIRTVKTMNKVTIGDEGTECNYLIFVFIIGLFYIISTE